MDKQRRYGKGNIDLYMRPQVQTPEGVATVKSRSFNFDGEETLIPTVVGNKVVSDAEAIRHYRLTGEHLGKFKTVKEADEYAEQLHKDQEELYSYPHR